MQITTIIFDLGGVYFTDGTARFIEEINARYDISKESLTKVVSGPLGTQYRSGRISRELFWLEAKRAWNLSVDTDGISSIWLEGYQPINGTVALVRRLRQAHYRLFFLSDNIAERVEYLQRKYNFLNEFLGGVFSHEVGTRKPDPAIYEAALKQSGAQPSECVYVDDKPDLLVPAAALGMHVLHFAGAESLARELRLKGVCC